MYTIFPWSRINTILFSGENLNSRPFGIGVCSTTFLSQARIGYVIRFTLHATQRT